MNPAQLAELRETVGRLIDAIIEEMPNQTLRERIIQNRKLEECLAPNSITAKEVYQYITVEDVEGLLQNDVPNDAKQALQQFQDFLRRRDENIPQALKQQLEKYPNYDPFSIAAIMKYQKELTGVNKECQDALVAIREAYLGLAPIGEYMIAVPGFQFGYRSERRPFDLANINLIDFGEIRTEMAKQVRESEGCTGATPNKLSRAEALREEEKLFAGAVEKDRQGIASGNLELREAAAAEFSRAIELRPDRAKSYFHRGCIEIEVQNFVSQKKKNYRQAGLDFDRAIELEPNNADAWLKKIETEIKRGFPELAKSHMHRLIKLAPGNARVFCELSGLANEIREPELADAWANEAIKLDNKMSYAYVARADARKRLNIKGNMRMALADIDKAIALQKDKGKPDAKLYFKRGRIKLSFKWVKEAGKDFEEAIRIEPRNPEVYLAIGLELKEVGMKKEASECFEKSIALDERQHGILGAFASADGNYQEALQHFDAFLRIDPRNYGGLLVRSDVYLKMGRLEEAKKDADTMISVDPKEPLGYGTRSKANARLGLTEEAKEDCKKACDLDPQSAEQYRKTLVEELGRLKPEISRPVSPRRTVSGLATKTVSL